MKNDLKILEYMAEHKTVTVLIFTILILIIILIGIFIKERN